MYNTNEAEAHTDRELTILVNNVNDNQISAIHLMISMMKAETSKSSSSQTVPSVFIRAQKDIIRSIHKCNSIFPECLHYQHCAATR